ncbi:MAG: transporter substrate-binding domain-containing protein [Dermatophilaceae bacterium]|nr:transporter substrate-binding domain-containing protein [Dermatophilaceae bacterium]NUR16749.1 transporter substrate-binding domain-containing protein [Dermatophilaceae bacterium]
MRTLWRGRGHRARAPAPLAYPATVTTSAPPPPHVVADLAPTGVLRASINLGNAVLAQGTLDEPRGVTVDIAHVVGGRLGVPVELVTFDGARKSFEAMATGAADICFLAIDPVREEEVAFTEPYVLIEGAYVVPVDSPLRTVADVDAEGVRVAVKGGSAYDLHLTRSLQHATLVRNDTGVGSLLSEPLEAGAGIREAVAAFAEANEGFRVVDGAFMQIRQAVGTTRTRSAESVAFLRDLVEELKASGFVADALERAGQRREAVAPPA